VSEASTTAPAGGTNAAAGTQSAVTTRGSRSTPPSPGRVADTRSADDASDVVEPLQLHQYHAGTGAAPLCMPTKQFVPARRPPSTV